MQHKQSYATKVATFLPPPLLLQPPLLPAVIPLWVNGALGTSWGLKGEVTAKKQQPYIPLFHK